MKRFLMNPKEKRKKKKFHHSIKRVVINIQYTQPFVRLLEKYLETNRLIFIP